MSGRLTFGMRSYGIPSYGCQALLVGGIMVYRCRGKWTEIGNRMNDQAALRVDRSAKTLRELALEKMRGAILELRFRPGDRLVERTLCEQLGVSRTVVREVLRHLEAEGLVESIPHQGPAVARPDETRVRQIYELRALLEGLAARACAENAGDKEIRELGAALRRVQQGYRKRDPNAVLKATTRFYEILFLAAGKSVAWEVVQSLNARITHLRAVTIATEGRNKTGVAEMQRIFDAISQRRPEEAYSASVEHVEAAARLAFATLTDLAGAPR